MATSYSPSNRPEYSEMKVIMMMEHVKTTNRIRECVTGQDKSSRRIRQTTILVPCLREYFCT